MTIDRHGLKRYCSGMTLDFKLILMAGIALFAGAGMAGALFWCLRRLKAIERRRWGDKTDARGHSV